MANPSMYGNIDIDLDIFVYTEFDLYLTDVEMARFSRANRWQYVRWMTLAIAAHHLLGRGHDSATGAAPAPGTTQLRV